MGWIETYTGKEFDPENPTPESICIEDIAHALSMKCRFSGHVKEFYSVAQHSIWVCNHLAPYGPAVQLAGLLHDAAEAYLIDMPTPIKHMFPEYRALENRVQLAIDRKFNLIVEHEEKKLIKSADVQALINEATVLMNNAPWIKGFEKQYGLKAERSILMMSREASEAEFGFQFERLMRHA